MSPANRVGLVRTSKIPIASKVSEIGIGYSLEKAMEEFNGGTWLLSLMVERDGETKRLEFDDRFLR